MSEKAKKYDLVIIGAGPAGLAASIYASRYKINHLVLGGLAGSQLDEAHLVENYPGFVSIKGADLVKKFKEHAEKFGTEIVPQDARGIKKLADDTFEITTGEHKTYQTKTIIFALGMKRRKLEIPGEEKFLGKGVSYCAVCDATFFKNKTVAVVGGSNSAAMSAAHLAEFAKKVYQIYRKDKLRSEPVWTDRVLKTKNIELIYKTNATEVKGENKVEEVKLDNPYQGKDSLKVDGLFVEIGHMPQVALVKQLNVALDHEGYIKIKPDGTTNIKGVYAAGDITDSSNKLQQALTSMSEGTIAATSIFQYLNQ
ncbi:NAD(P)/FAD-dependent oxidoreductase [Patescibacteria group bacterium]